ncbi:MULTISPECIES: hypothetical protein [Pseudoxanthomonas]|uniref:Uncharacterized protein n=1 Tax=Pseudoxanthomonas winnipegensis TaxID=2480810 RepID=A0A4Q8M3A6_9GAMM|nr:hypothetical protein [Pseudoxanthomonas winnipegensis]TAA42467.1 hypothetical protein EA655_10575 [Pseudoxanthomonas winnipegensis]
MSEEITLGGVTLSADLDWTDEFTAWRVGQNVRTSLTGAQIIQEAALQSGRPITLESGQDAGGSYYGVLTLAQVRALQALEQVPGSAPMLLTMPAHNSGDRSFDVIWRRTDGAAIEARQIQRRWPQLDDDFYTVTLRLMTA